MAGDKNPSRALSTFTHKAAYLNLLSKKLKELLDIKVTLSLILNVETRKEVLMMNISIIHLAEILEKINKIQELLDSETALSASQKEKYSQLLLSIAYSIVERHEYILIA